MKKLSFVLILVFGILLISCSLFFIFIRAPITSTELRADETKQDYSSSSSVIVIKQGELNSIDLGIEGMKIKEFSVDGIKTDNLDFKGDDFDLRTEFKKTREKLKQDIYLTNNKGQKQFNFSTVVEIDYSEIRWNGIRYKLTSAPVELRPYYKDGNLIVPNIFMDDVYHKRINYKDIAEKGGYALAYEDKGKYYVELRIDNLNIKSSEEYYIDPEYFNRTDGFSVIPFGATDPYGITGNDTDLWIADPTDDFIYHVTKLGVNLSGGLSTVAFDSNAPRGLHGNGTDLWVADLSDEFIYHVLEDGTNLTEGFSTIVFNVADPQGIWGNDTDFWIADDSDDFIYHVTRLGVNLTEGFPAAPISQGDIQCLWGADDTSLWATSYNAVFIYHFSRLGVNITDGFTGASFGASAPQGIFGDATDLWITDATDDFVYHLSTETLSVDLVSPADNAEMNVTSGYSVNFIGDFNTTADLILYNTTLSIWNETGGLVLENFLEIEGGATTTNRTNLTVLNLDYGEYLWNYAACSNDSITLLCETASANSTFNTTLQYKVNYTTDTFVLLEETFIINVSYNNLVYPTIIGTFEYNNTVYTASKKSDNGGYAYFENSLVIPNVAANITLMWNFTLSNTTSSTKQNTIKYNQSIVAYEIDDCITHGLLILNYSLKDEDTQTQFVAATENTTIEIDVDIYQKGQRTTIIEFSQNYTEINPAKVCLGNRTLDNNDYEMDVIVRYTATNYVSEYHNIQNFTLTNSSVPQNINLFDLLSSRSTSFLITYKDSTFNPVENALLDISRRYIADGNSKSVEIPKTDAKGQAVAHLVVSETVYTITVKKDGVTLATFDNVMAICDDVLAEDCKINLNAFSTGLPTEDWDTYQNLDYTLNWDEDAREIELVFTVVDGSSQTVDLNATRFDRFGNLTVCSDTITSSSGTISCIVPQSFGNISIIAEVYKSSEMIASSSYKIAVSPEETFGGTVYILLLLMMITLPLMFITSAIGVVIGAMLGLIMAALLNVFAAGSWIAQGSTIVWLIIAGGILIWKISQRARG